MNVLKIAFLLVFGTSFGFGVNQVVERLEESDVPFGHCLRADWDIEHMLDGLSEEDRLLVEAKLDELLVEHGVTIEDLQDDWELRHDIMWDLMDFLADNDIAYSDDDDGFGRHGMMH